ncbi:phage major capsid protein [Paenibacillus chitinolyticus]|uniref:phage major capsid protein n=1 Tax=Paenibacillus chitinolyticus TaxID=79263 RepID=UPI0035E0F3D1
MAGVVISKASGVNDSVFGKSQEPLKLYVEQQIEAFEQNSIRSLVYYEDETNNYSEKYSYETSLGDFEAVGEGGAYPRSSFQEGFSKVIEPDEWKNSFEVTKQMAEDSKIGKMQQRASQFTLSYNRGREKFATGILNYGSSPTMAFGTNNKIFDITAADKKPLFATDHPSVTGGYGTQSNYFGNAFSYDALSLVEEAMQNFRDDDGNLLNMMPDTIIIPNKARIKKLVFDAVGADGIPNTGNNSFSYQYDRWNIIISPYLNNANGITSGTDSWYVMDSTFNQNYSGLVWLERVALEVNSYIDQNTDNNVWKGRARFGAAPNNWRAIAKVDPGLGTILT